MRLQSYLSKSGLASRRKAADFIREGKVTVNGSVVREPGAAVDPAKDEICFGKKEVRSAQAVYYVFHKPVNVITSASDPQGRRTAVDFFSGIPHRVFPVGRLDRNTTGLLLMTNDGDLANELMHPRYGVVKRYAVLTDRCLSPNQMEKFRRGMRLEGGKTRACEIKDYGPKGRHYAYEVALKEGKNRQIRRMMEILGHSVKALHRFEYGPLELGHLKPGHFRSLSPAEVKRLRDSVNKRDPI